LLFTILAHGSDVVCPEDTTAAGSPPPEGRAVACVDKTGAKHGPFMMWHSDGKPYKKGAYKNGQPDGLYEEWHDNGQKKARGQFVDGKMSGQWSRWHSNGVKKEEGSWDAGKAVGKWTFWNEKGKSVLSPEDDFPSAVSLGTVFIIPNEETTNSISVELSLLPRFRLNRQFLIQGKASFIPYPQASTNHLQVIMSYEAMFLYHPSWARFFGIALGGGGVTWTGRRTGPQGEVGLYFNKLINVGYSAWMLPGYFTHVAHLGFEIHL
jgi:hypothetical protein